jgi:hypothetical protein
MVQIVLKSFWAISRIHAELKTDVSEISVLITVDDASNLARYRLLSEADLRLNLMLKTAEFEFEAWGSEIP